MITIFITFQDTHIITEISIYALVFGAASQHLDDFLESNSRNCDFILAVTVASSDGLGNGTIAEKTLLPIVRNNYKR